MGVVCGRYVGAGLHRARWGYEREREREKHCKMKALQDIATYRYYRTMQHEDTRGHCKMKALDIATYRYYRTMQHEGTRGHCKIKILQDITT
jgi:hypothetical protein